MYQTLLEYAFLSFFFGVCVCVCPNSNNVHIWELSLKVISSIMMENADDEKHDLKRVFLSEEKNDNVLDCIISKVKIVHIDPNVSGLSQNLVLPHACKFHILIFPFISFRWNQKPKLDGWLIVICTMTCHTPLLIQHLLISHLVNCSVLVAS